MAGKGHATDLTAPTDVEFKLLDGLRQTIEDQKNYVDQLRRERQRRLERGGFLQQAGSSILGLEQSPSSRYTPSPGSSNSSNSSQGLPPKIPPIHATKRMVVS